MDLIPTNFLQKVLHHYLKLVSIIETWDACKTYHLSISPKKCDFITQNWQHFLNIELWISPAFKNYQDYLLTKPWILFIFFKKHDIKGSTSLDTYNNARYIT